MPRTVLLGGLVALLGLAGYVTGIYVAYPGRAFSLTAIMAGITLVAIGTRPPSEKQGPDR